MTRHVSIGSITICVQHLPDLDLFKFTWCMADSLIGVKYLRKFEGIQSPNYDLIQNDTDIVFRADHEGETYVRYIQNVEFLSTVRTNLIIGAEDNFTYLNVGMNHVAWFILHGGYKVCIGSVMKPVYKYNNIYYMVNEHNMIEQCVTHLIPEGYDPQFYMPRLLYEIEDPPILKTTDDVTINDAKSGPLGSIILGNGAVHYLEMCNYELQLINLAGEVVTLLDGNF
jgi:hypothetical protein